MKYSDFEEMRKKAILYDSIQRSNEIAENFRAAIAALDAYEESIGDSTKVFKEEPWQWIPTKPKKKLKKVKAIKSAGGHCASRIASAELREIFY